MSRISCLCALVAGSLPVCALAQPDPWILPAPTALDRPILLALEQTVSFRFEQIPLQEFSNELQRRFGINVELDVQALEDAGLSPQSNVSLDARGVKLKQALRRVLKPIEAAFVIQDGALSITSKESADGTLTLRVYDVTELIRPVNGQPDFDSLIEIITSTIEPQSWDEVGGPGTIEEFRLPDYRGCFIVFSQTLDVHEQTEALLQALWDFERLPHRRSSFSRTTSKGSRSANRSPAAGTRSPAAGSPATADNRRNSPRNARQYADIPGWATPALHD